MSKSEDKTLNVSPYFDRFLADAEWETVERQSEVHDPYKTTEEEVCITLKVQI